MSKFYTFFFLFIGVFGSAQTGIKFDEGAFSEILDKAKVENKLVFVDAYAEWCAPCKLMEKNVFSQKEVGAFYNANFINAQIDMEKGEGRELARIYSVRAYPSYLFIDGNGKLVHRALGYLENKDFIAAGERAIIPDKQISTMKKKYEAGDRDPVLLRDIAIETLHSEPEFSKKVATEYLQAKKGDDYDTIDFQLLLMGIESTKSPNYKIFKREKIGIINSTVPQDTYEEMDLNINAKEVFQMFYNKATDTLDQPNFVEELAKRVGEEQAKMALDSYLRQK